MLCRDQDLLGYILELDGFSITLDDPSAPKMALAVSIRSESISKSTKAILRNVSFKIWTFLKLDGIDNTLEALHG